MVYNYTKVWNTFKKKKRKKKQHRERKIKDIILHENKSVNKNIVKCMLTRRHVHTHIHTHTRTHTYTQNDRIIGEGWAEEGKQELLLFKNCVKR